MKNISELISEIRVGDISNYYIYGAQVVAYGALTALSLLTGKKPRCFLVTNSENNPTDIEGVEVCELREIDIKPEDFIIVAVTELLQSEIAKTLKDKGHLNFFLLSQEQEHILMSNYFTSVGLFPLAKESNMNNAELCLYEIKNHRDKKLNNKPAYREYEVSIQAGAALTDERIAELVDDTGENISLKNRQYCEMSAVYWIWKNRNDEWIGIEHYRRHFLVSPQMMGENVDVIMPLPYICYPNTIAQFKRFVSNEVYEAMLKALKDLHPDEYSDYLQILYGKYQYTYNLSAMRREVFDDYCNWFFDICMYMENMSDKVPEIATTRALSYVAEVLTNLYFMHNKRAWIIRHTEKRIYT